MNTPRQAQRKARQTRQAEQVEALLFPEQMESVIKAAALRYRGDARTLESAIGALTVGQLYGWKVLRLIHGSAAYKGYEQILGVTFRELCPERGPLAERSVGIRLADSLGGFWKVATGKVKGGRTAELNDELEHHQSAN